MRARSLFLVLSLLVAAASSAQTRLFFDPPNPTSRTPVLAHVELPNASCAIASATVTRVGQNINIDLTSSTLCTPINVPPSGARIAVDLGALPPGVYRATAGSGAILLPLTEATLVVRDAQPRFDVLPDAAPAPGDPVHLIGTQIGPCSATCAHVDVRFGDALAEVLSVNRGEIVVKPPAKLAPGVYDISIVSIAGELKVPAAFHVGPPDEAFYERVLFPVFFFGRGAFGSQWFTEATVYNGLSVPWITPQPSIFAPPCTPECVRPQPGQSMYGVGPSSDTGVVEWVTRQEAAVSDFGLLVRDLSRNAQDLGTEVPVVRESGLHERRFQLLDVPTDPRYRVALRLYDLDGPATFLLYVYSMGPLAPPLVQREVRLTTAGSLQGVGNLMVNDLIDAIPESARGGAVRIEIVPLTASGTGREGTGLKSAWGFVTATNNETQHVTVISPH